MLGASLAFSSSTAPAIEFSKEPILPLVAREREDPEKVALGDQIFRDKRLSSDGTRSCASCHDLETNGATARGHDLDPNGQPLRFNTPTVFNTGLMFRLGWRGRFATLENQAIDSFESPRTLDVNIKTVVDRLAADEVIRRKFVAIYGRPPNRADVADAVATFERSLTTPSKFDRYLRGDRAALTELEDEGYQLFKSLGCAACHQGIAIGGNLYAQPGVYHPLTQSAPELLRVPSLRNVAITPPYFHDGSATTLDDAIRRMARAQLNADLADRDVRALVAFLGSLTGDGRQPARPSP
jgi:cytochrome c peroxidase